jgi:hypothetical protein
LEFDTQLGGGSTWSFTPPVSASWWRLRSKSDLARLEQLLRWFEAKVEALPSWEGWAHIGPTSASSRILIVRSTRTTRAIGREFRQQLAAAYPAHPADAIAALTGTAAWPGAALVWAEFEARRVRFISRR